jgi:excisionase family DNA binding protein
VGQSSNNVSGLVNLTGWLCVSVLWLFREARPNHESGLGRAFLHFRESPKEETTMETQNMYTAEEVAKKLRISRASLSRLIQAGKIAYYRIGERTMFDEDSLKNFREATFQQSVESNVRLRKEEKRDV